MPMIDVLLATYNGARFLPEQLLSLEQQTFTDWRLVVRDDGSSDGSLELVRDWAARTGKPVHMVEDGRKNLGASGNFAALLGLSEAPHFAFCDQDDFWLPNKLSLMRDHLVAAEARCGQDKPLFAYSDLRLADAELREFHPSFRAFASLSTPQPGKSLPRLLLQNIVVGCASMGNAALRRAALPIAPEAVMHDWWLALVASGTGDLVDVPEATILYRQHGKNASDPVDWSWGSMIARVALNPGASLKRARSFIDATQRQAQALHNRFEARLDSEVAEIVREYGALRGRPILERKKFVVDKNLWSNRFIRNAALLALI